MLEEKTILIVQSTAPILKEHSKEIGLRFYKLLFEKAPDLYNIFNQTNQKRGIQQEALGYTVYAAGEYITNLDAIKPVIERISQKHRAIGIKAEQYPVVGETLLQAVKDVLGDAATDEIINAWEKAYSYISDAFISLEEKLYEETKKQAGGWEGYKDFYIEKKIKESEDVTSFYLKPKDGKEMAIYKPGQYLTLKATIPGEKYTHIRHYSISEAPGKDYYRISVKREDDDRSTPEGIVSNYLHNEIKEGDILLFSAPAGDFVLDTKDTSLVLVSGGIGITPILSMLNSVVSEQPNREVTLIYATKNGKYHPFKEHIKQLEKRHTNLKTLVCYDSPTTEDKQGLDFYLKGYVNQDLLNSVIKNKDTEVYLCGSVPFMQAIVSILDKIGVPRSYIHFESFSPLAILGEE